MSRFHIQLDEHRSMSYGYDRPLQGYFIQIYDERYAWKEENTPEENEAAEAVDWTGEGEVESYATNNMLLAKKVVSRSRILEILEENGVPEDHLHQVALDLPIV